MAIPVHIVSSDVALGGGGLAPEDVTASAPLVATPGDGTVALSADVGTGADQLAAGNHTHAFSAITGKPSTYAPTIGTTGTTAAAGNHVHAASAVTATAVPGGSATNVQGILDELEARIAALEALQA
jgi:hypothetical protein